MPNRKSGFSPQKQAQLEKLRRLKGLVSKIEESFDPEVVVPDLAEVTSGEPPPVSFLEEAYHRRWLHGRIGAVGSVDTPYWPLWGGFVVDGTLDAEALSRSFSDLVHRHPVLRSVYRSEGDRLTKRIADCPSPYAKLIDLSNLPDEDRRPAALARITEGLRRGFNVHLDVPLISLEIFRLGDRRHLLSLAVEHLVSDKSSLELIWTELRKLYQHHLDPSAPTPLAPGVHYSDFARWQRRLHSGESLNAARAFWLERMRGASPIVRSLPSDFPRHYLEALHQQSDLAASPAGTVNSRLPSELTGEIVALARELSTFPFVILQTAYAAVLAAMAHQTDVTVSISNDLRRRIIGITDCIGVMVISPLLRVIVRADSWRELICQIDRELRAIMSGPAIQLVPFCFPNRSLFRVLFNFVPVASAPGSWPGLTFQAVPSHEVTRGPNKPPAGGDLTLLVFWREDLPIAFRVVYSEMLWSEETAREFADRYVATLLRVVRDPSSSVCPA